MDNSQRNKYIQYIYDHVNEVKPSFRKELLQIIICGNVPDCKIIEKGNGTQIKFSDIPDSLLGNIYTYLYNKIENNNVLFQ